MPEHVVERAVFEDDKNDHGNFIGERSHNSAHFLHAAVAKLVERYPLRKIRSAQFLFLPTFYSLSG